MQTNICKLLNFKTKIGGVSLRIQVRKRNSEKNGEKHSS